MVRRDGDMCTSNAAGTPCAGGRRQDGAASGLLCFSLVGLQAINRCTLGRDVGGMRLERGEPGERSRETEGLAGGCVVKMATGGKQQEGREADGSSSDDGGGRRSVPGRKPYFSGRRFGWLVVVAALSLSGTRRYVASSGGGKTQGLPPLAWSSRGLLLW